MRFLQVILSLSLLLVVPLLLVESSSLNDTLFGNITRGSSLSTSFLPNHWLSPSGNIAFGFYLLSCESSSSYCPDRYVVGIWFEKSTFKTLVWTANHNDLHGRPSSILLTDEGKLVLRIMPDNLELPLIPNIQEPVAYAMMHDNGNFVLYGSESQVVWESFDHPTDTILGGQKLKPGVDLVSGGKRLSVQQSNGLVAIYAKDNDQAKIVSVLSKALGSSLSKPVSLSLDATGELYLVGSDDAALKYLHRNKNPQRRQRAEGSDSNKDVYIYRATLDPEGHRTDDFVGYFNLYKERIDGNISDHEKSSVLVWPLPAYDWSPVYFLSIMIGPWLLLAICCICNKCIVGRERKKIIPTPDGLETIKV